MRKRDRSNFGGSGVVAAPGPNSRSPSFSNSSSAATCYLREAGTTRDPCWSATIVRTVYVRRESRIRLLRKGLSKSLRQVPETETAVLSLCESAGEITWQMGRGITRAVMQRCKWVKPVLIAQVKFREWTHDDQLRQPVFLGLRTDKEAKDVVRE